MVTSSRDFAQFDNSAAKRDISWFTRDISWFTRDISWFTVNSRDISW